MSITIPLHNPRSTSKSILLNGCEQTNRRVKREGGFKHEKGFNANFFNGPTACCGDSNDSMWQQ